MANNIVDKLKLKSGEFFNFKPEGYDKLVEKVAELCKAAGLDTIPSGESEPAPSPSPSGQVTKDVKFKANRKNVRVTVNYTKKDGSAASVTKTLAKKDITYIVCSDADLDKSKPINYIADLLDGNGNTVEKITNDTRIKGNGVNSVFVTLTFSKIVPSSYYLRVNGKEDSSPKYHIGHTGGTFTLNIETNVVYNIRIYSRSGNYSFFTMDGQQYTKLTNIRDCSGNKTVQLSFNEFNYIPSSIADFGPREEEKYSMSVYSYGANTSSMYRDLEIAIEVSDKKYKDDVDTIIVHLFQDSIYAEEENQTVEMNMSDDIRNGFLCPSGGSFTFKIKPKTYWYIYNEFESGFGVPNYMSFSPSEGGPSDNWITITASWTSDKAHPTSFRDILMKICSVLTDKVICEKKWDGVTYYTQKFRLMASLYSRDPSGESESSNGECASRAYIEKFGFGVLNSFVGTGLTQYGEIYPNNLLELYKEEKEIEVYVKSNIDYKLERESLPSCVQNMVYVKSLNGSTEGHPGQHLYKFTLTENDTYDDRVIDIKFSSNDSRFTGSTVSHITQHGTYQFDKNPEHKEYSYIKEGTMWRMNGEYDSLSIHTICHKNYVISAKKNYTYEVPMYSSYTFENPHSPNNELEEINLINVGTIDETDLEKYRGRFYIMLNEASTGGRNYITGDSVLCFKLGAPQKIIKVIG